MTRIVLSEVMNKIRSGHAAETVASLVKATAVSHAATMEHALLIEATLAAQGRNDALGILRAAIELPPRDADVADALAYYARQLDQHELSNTLYRKAVGLAPGIADFWFNLATSERALGRFAEASEACERALSLSPNHRPAILLRSEVLTATNDTNHVSELKRRIDSSKSSVDAMFFQYALGKELHDLGEYDDAFRAFAHGARIRRANLQYDVASDEAKLARVAEVFNQSGTQVDQGPWKHIFVVGLPRSGTTLTERILGGLLGVRSNNETNNFSNALLSVAPQAGDVFANCAATDPARVADEYERLANPDGFPGKIVEKLPFNYLYVGAIWRAFANAPIVWVRRNPIDNCFAMFRTLFGAGYPFSYDFSDLARYFAAYQRLMDHWEAIYPERLIKVDYEGLVSEAATTGTRIAERCGLAWDDAALDLRRNSSASLTASAAQVRGGIYTSSSGLWRKYGRNLDPLVAALDQEGVRLP